MEPNPTRAKHQKEAVLVAQDVFHYLSSSIFPKNVIQRPNEKSNYHQNIGKACSYRLKFARSSFREVCSKEFPDRSLGSKDFVSWFQGVLSRNCQECTSPFSAAIESLSLMFEAVCFASEKGQTKLYQILPIMWTNHFMQKLYPEFFNKGGWHNLIKLATETVESYEKFFLTSEAGALELIAGFKEDDPAPTEVAEKSGTKKERQIIVPYMLQKAGFPAQVDASSNLAKTLRGLLSLSLGHIGQDAIDYYMQECVMGATPGERLPGNRKIDPLRTYDTSPEVSPQESPVCAKKNSGKETSAKKKKDTSPEVSPQESPVCAKKNSGKETSEKKKKDTSPEVSPQESPVCTKKNSGKETSAKKKKDTSPEVSPQESPVCTKKNSGKETSAKKKKEKSGINESEPRPPRVINKMIYTTPGDRLPGNRSSPEVSPRESPVPARKKSGKETNAKKKKEKSDINEDEPYPIEASLDINMMLWATPEDRLPGNREVDSVYDTSPEVSPQESPVCARKSYREIYARRKKERSGINESEGHPTDSLLRQRPKKYTAGKGKRA